MARYYRGRRRVHGSEYARRHIEAAERLSKELGGTDQDVKDYFFSLPKAELEAVLAEYGRRHGANAAAYARNTIRSWELGTTRMSGLVAGRLFALLPEHMPYERKYALAASLWNHVAPGSETTIVAGPTTRIDEVIAQIRTVLDRFITEHPFPESMQKRFDWLAGGDVDVMRKLQAAIRNQERSLLKQLSETEVTQLMTSFLQQTADGHHSRIIHTLKVGRHQCHLDLRQNATEMEVRPGAPDRNAASSANDDNPWAFPIAAAIVIGLIIMAHL